MKIYYNSFKLFGRDVPIYGLVFILGFAIAIVTAIPKLKRNKLPAVELVVSAVFAALGGIFGAKVLGIITAIPTIADYYKATGTIPWLAMIKGGFVFYGGLVGGAAGLFLYCKIFKVPFAKYADMYAAGTALGHAFGRVGCLFSGCCYGMRVSGGFCVIYYSSIDSSTPLGEPLLPTALIEVFYLLAIYVICEILFYRTDKDGISALAYGYLYCIARFILEFFRGDDVRGLLFGISTSQYISIAIFILCTVLVVTRVIKSRKEQKPPETAA